MPGKYFLFVCVARKRCGFKWTPSKLKCEPEVTSTLQA